MAVNKVVYGTTVLVDLTGDTVTADKLMQGYTAHDRSGALITGIATGEGGDSYTLTTIVPQQTFTVSDSDHQATLTSTGGFEDGELYLITFDGEEYASPCELLWGADYTIGDVNPFMGNYTAANVFPVGLIWEYGVMNVATKDTSQHTIKVEHLEFVDGPLTIIPKSVTANGTYNASSDNADGYSSVTVNVSGGGNDFVVTLAKNSQTDEWEPDCTYAEAYAAYQAGKTIVADAGSYTAASIDYDSGDGCFYYSVMEGFDEPNGTEYYNYGIDSHDYIWDSSGAEPDSIMRCYATEGANAVPSDVANGKRFFNASGIQTGTASGSTPSLQSKTATPTTSQQVITADSGYDGLSQVTVSAMPSGTAGTPSATKGSVSNHSVSVTPSVTNTTGYITGGTKTGTAVTVSASELVSGNKAITQNGNNIDVTDYATVSVNVPTGGSSMNVQVAQSTTRVANTAYTKTASLTCAVSGTYDVYWDCFRSTTSGTSGSQLYIGGTASGSANTTFSNHAQNNHRTGVHINANQEVAIYVRSRATNYYAYCGQLTIVQTA